MGGKGGKKRGNGAAAAAQPRVCTTLREESRGKKQGHVNAKAMCKLDYLKNLAVWAATEAFVPSLGAVYGERLAATTEALGIRGDPSLFVCERCESILQPGHNCTVRIEKNKSKMRRKSKKSNPTLQNNVVYRCHFCSHRNLMRGTPKGYVKEISAPKAKPPSKFQPTKLAVEKHAGSTKPTTGILAANQADAIDLPTADGQNVEASNPASPLPTTGVSLLDSKRRKRNRSSAKKVVEHETISTEANAEKSIQSSNKRRKKSWTSLKEIAQSSEHDAGKKKFTNLIIPFFI